MKKMLQLLGVASLSNVCMDTKKDYKELGCCSSHPLVPKGVDGVKVTAEPCPTSIKLWGTNDTFPTGANPDYGCIYLGLLNDYTGPYTPLSRTLELGQRAFWLKKNQMNSLYGKSGAYSVAILTGEDTVYDPIKHDEAYDKLRDKVFALGMSIGTPQTLYILDKLVEDKMLTTPMSWTSGWKNTAYDKHMVVEFGSTYCNDASILFQHWYNNIRDKTLTNPKIGFIGYEGDYGGDSLSGLIHGVEKQGLEIDWAILPDVQELVSKIANLGAYLVSNPVDVLFLSSAPAMSAQFVGALAESEHPMPYILMATPAFNEAFVSPEFPLKSVFEGGALVSGFVPPFQYDSVGHEEMRTTLKPFTESSSTFLAAGWGSQWGLYNVFKTLVDSGKDMTQQNAVDIAASNLKIESNGMMQDYYLNAELIKSDVDGVQQGYPSYFSTPDGSIPSGVRYLGKKGENIPLERCANLAREYTNLVNVSAL